MLGGGFLKQSQDSFEKNREMRKAALKGSRDKSTFQFRIAEPIDSKAYKISAEDRAVIVTRARFESRKDQIITWTILLAMAVAISLSLYYLLG
jgi:hypothetical protein